MIPVTSYVGIGSNLGTKRTAIASALSYLDDRRSIWIERVSSLYETLPQGGPKGQPLYLNAAAKISTTLTPFDLLARCKEIERKLGRRPAVRWGPRIIDLDILLYDTLIVMSKRLTIPHVLLHTRTFVLQPLAEIAGRKKHPVCAQSMRSLLRSCNRLQYH